MKTETLSIPLLLLGISLLLLGIVHVILPASPPSNTNKTITDSYSNKTYGIVCLDGIEYYKGYGSLALRIDNTGAFAQCSEAYVLKHRDK